MYCAVTNHRALRNVAVGRPAAQISIHADGYGSHAASLANDGNRATDYRVTVNGCAASNRESYPWWAVDLGEPTVVCLVKLTNLQSANGIKLRILYISLTPSPYFYVLFILSISRFVFEHTNLFTTPPPVKRTGNNYILAILCNLPILLLVCMHTVKEASWSLCCLTK